MGSRAAFLASCALLLFLTGTLVNRHRVFPYFVLQAGENSVKRTWHTLMYHLGRPSTFVKAARYPGNGLTVFDAAHTSPGLTLLSGFFDGGTEVRLIRSNGSIVHRWPVRVLDLFEDFAFVRPSVSVPAHNWGAEIHGVWALPDGSVVLNFDYVGAAKIDRCGAVVWTLRRLAHHSLEPASDGGFWIPSQRYVEDHSRFPALIPPYREDTILHVSAGGQVIKEMSVLDLLFKNDLQAFLFANLKGLQLATADSLEFTHLNDVEELTREVAEGFSGFAAGDLLVSLRNQNLLLVVDPVTEIVKWHKAGPWLRQHDPDFQADGTITVFNNNDDGTKTGAVLGGSNIMTVEPATDRTSVAYGTRPGQTWYTDVMGKHQRLDNGHFLITETLAGRVFEVDPEGQVVWEYINRYDNDEVLVVTQATRYPESYFAVDEWACR
jgi:hypothetical protein